MLLPHFRGDAEREAEPRADVPQVQEEKDRVHIRLVVLLGVVREDDDVLRLLRQLRDGLLLQEVFRGEIDEERLLAAGDRGEHRLPVGLAHHVEGDLGHVFRKLVQDGAERFQAADDGDLFLFLLRTLLRIEREFPRFRRFDQLRGVVFLREDEDAVLFGNARVLRRVDADPAGAAVFSGSAAPARDRMYVVHLI